MKLVYSISGARQLTRRIPLYGAGTLIPAGAAVMRGATAGTNQGYGIVAASTIPGFIGVTEAKLAAATLDNDPNAGTKYILTPVAVNYDAVWAADYDQSAGLTIASMNSGTPTVTSLEDVSGGWLLAISGPGAGILAYVLSVSAGAATLKTAQTAWTTGTKLIKIMPLFAPKVDLITDATKIKGNTAGQGTGLCAIVDNYVRAAGFDNIQLDPTKHDNITFPTGNVFTAYAVFTSRAWI